MLGAEKHLRSVSLTHISLALVGLMWVLPFLAYRHAYPLTTFYQEWWSALLGVLALTLLATRDFWQKPEIPRFAQLPVALIGVILLQWGLGMIPYFDQTLLYVFYLLFAALLMLLGARLRESLGMTKLAQVLAIFLLAGAEINALIAVLQHFHWSTPLDSVIVIKVFSSVYGNIAQANHFANYIALGMISLGLLFQQNKLRAGYVAVMAIPLLFVMTLSGSRSSWLYLLMMAGLAWWWALRDTRQRPLLRYCLLLIAGFVMMHLVVQLIVQQPLEVASDSSANTVQQSLVADADSSVDAVQQPLVAGPESSVNTLQRILSDKGSSGVRLYLWREATMMFMQSPWLGVGFGQFAWQHFQLLPELRPNGITGLYNNAHNLLFQLAAETGIAGLLAFLFSLAVWLIGLRRATLDAAHWWGYAALGVLTIHSMVEYPLWYIYFVAVASILLGALDETRYSLDMRKVGRMSATVILLLGLITLIQLLSGYRDMEQVEAIYSSPSIDADATKLLRDKLVTIHGGSLLSSYAELYMSRMIEVNEEHLKEKLAMSTRVMHFTPVQGYHQAMLLAQADQLEQAKTMLVQAIWSFPGDFGYAHKQMVELAEKDPAHFSVLLEFAIQKEKEYWSAIYQQ